MPAFVLGRPTFLLEKYYPWVFKKVKSRSGFISCHLHTLFTILFFSLILISVKIICLSLKK